MLPSQLMGADGKVVHSFTSDGMARVVTWQGNAYVLRRGPSPAVTYDYAGPPLSLA